MSIPIDRLYQYIENIVEQIYQDPVVIYRFFPHGSKKLEDLQTVYWLSLSDMITRLPIYCNDQEPLNFDFYENYNNNYKNDLTKLLIEESEYEAPNLKKNTIYDSVILLHSEQRSDNLIKYQNKNYIPAYYWSHAIISQDWFRFAQYIKQKKNVKKTFLIYNRAWSGTREYRLKFSEFLIRLGLEDHCQTSVNPVEPELGIHYEIHKFKNPTWRPNFPLENFFPTSNAHSHYSADFDIEDYNATDIEVVLETLFDDSRLHLTEKSLRPIACGQPFILAGTHGSLEYLRSYGFKTFNDIWDEQYDLVEDPEERLIRITDLMRHITDWTPKVREQKMAQAQAIADHNQQHFFSQEFFNTINTELTDNLKQAIQTLVNTNTYQVFLKKWETIFNKPTLKNYLENSNDKINNAKFFRELCNLVENQYVPKLVPPEGFGPPDPAFLER